MSHVVREAGGPIFKNNPKVMVKGTNLMCGGVKPIDNDFTSSRGHTSVKITKNYTSMSTSE